MHSKSDNIEIIINDEADEVIKALFDSPKKDIKIIKNGWKVVSLSSVMFIYCIRNKINHKINPNCGGSFSWMDW